MDGDVLMFAQVMAVIIGSAASLAVVVLGARVLWRLGSRTAAPAGTTTEQRLERLHVAVEAMAIEVERISEGQRFTVGLLTDRARTPERLTEVPPSRATGQLHTPH